MSGAPDYRLRIFLSVDLVGSTAFKAMEQFSGSNGDDPSPAWVATFRSFYTEFQKFLKTAYDEEYRASQKNSPHVDEQGRHPAIWKTVGDEIIFCGRVLTIEHAAVTVSAFVRALEQFAQKLKQDKLPLNVKGACWLAAFPAPNATIEVVTPREPSENAPVTGPIKSPEAIREDRADQQPHLFDFLGKGIDTGFRIAKNATEDRCVLSVQMAYLLAKATTKKRFHHSLGFHGRETLKGVVNGIPYPVISVDTERNELNWMLKSREAMLRGERSVDEYALCDFLQTFMQVANIEEPCLSFRDDTHPLCFPASYKLYTQHFDQNDRIDEARLRDLEPSSDPAPSDASANSFDDAQAFLDKIVPESKEDPLSGALMKSEQQDSQPVPDSTPAQQADAV